MAECFLALASSLSKVSARSTVSPYRWSMSDFCRDLSTTSCARQQLSLGYSFCWTRLLKGTVTYLHPLLSPPHRFHVASYRCRADKVIRQKLKSIPTSHGGLGHRRRTDQLRV
jgi:hypothetical protein